MAKFDRPIEETSSRLKNIISIIILFVLIIVLIFSAIFISHENRKLINDTNDIDKVIMMLQEDVVKQIETISSTTLEIEKNRETSNLIKQLKDEYPLLAKELENKIQLDKTDAKIAYLTFDDGPYKLTNKYLDILDEYDVRATFFTLEKDEVYGWSDEDLENVDNVYKRIISEGHTLGNHTSSHKIKNIYKSVDSFMDNVIEHKNFTINKYNYETSVFRFPGGSSTPDEDFKNEVVDRLVKEGYGYVDWNSQTGDGTSKTAVGVKQSIANVLDTTKNRKFLVVLMHDYSETTLEALPSIIEGLKNQGYTLLPLFHDSIMVNKE